MIGYVPQKCRDLARDRRGGDGRLLALGRQSPVSRAQANLRFPSDIANLLRQLCLATLVCIADAGRVTIGPRRFDQRLAGTDVACLGDASLAPRFPVERSNGTRPRNAISCRGCSKRRMSPASAITLAAVVNATPRTASCVSSGSHTALNSPALCRRPSSVRRVGSSSPARLASAGSSRRHDRATRPSARICRYRLNPGPRLHSKNAASRNDRELANHPGDCIRRSVEFTKIADLSAPPDRGDRYGISRLGGIVQPSPRDIAATFRASRSFFPDRQIWVYQKHLTDLHGTLLKPTAYVATLHAPSP